MLSDSTVVCESPCLDEAPSCFGLPDDVQAELNAIYDERDRLDWQAQQEPPEDYELQTVAA